MRRLTLLAAGTAATLALTACGASPPSPTAPLTSPEVVASASSPTGYEVTFRFDAPEAEAVWLAGDLYFTEPDAVGLAGASWSWLGDEWSEGDVSAPPLAEDLAEMTRGEDGVWELTTAVPAGLWNYGFVTRECSVILLCTVAADPANPPPLEAQPGATQAWSQLFVPVDQAHPTYDAAGQLPTAAAEQGTVEVRTYPSDLSIDPAGEHRMGVYLPAGYDPDRTEPYPLLVLSHGAGGDEASWWVEGGAAQLLDHAIADGVIPPVVAVTTAFEGLSEDGMADPDFWDLYTAELIDSVLPYAEAELDATADPALRAFGGLSMGARLSEHLLLTQPDLFGAYGIWSMPEAVASPAAAELGDADLAVAATARAVHLGTGAEDALAPAPEDFEELAARYREAGLDAATYATHGGHTWWVWRQMLGDFLATTAFAG
ncbi:alpha/beta hydrolase-fold protein [Demequina gelatinilytica]|uniref:alpha/beta hydrolase-fold protein n=1 Tax=Demequina gelatinilytica TaxID=1638980 RepID=UPI000783AA06|nr:alpha/beta hydrolase-fold protein [Demequina gelatinilytica]